MGLKPDVMVVDDDAIAIQTLGQILGGFARLRFARSGLDALRLVQQDPPDLMLLDAEMPGMNGLQVLDRLSFERDRPSFPVIVVTSHREPELEAAVFAAGAVDILPKPLLAAEVLARVRAHLHVKQVQQSMPRLPEAYAKFSSASILVVDDDVSAIELMQRVLSPTVQQIRFATDGESALRLMREQAPDLVLLDIQMPGMDGFAVCQAMQDDLVLRHVPIALITRFSDPAQEARALELGATDFVAKPYQPAVLTARVRNLLRLKKERDDTLHALSEHWQHLGDARVADIVGAASDAIVSVDANGSIVLINAAACVLFGVESRAVLKHALIDALPGAASLMGVLTGFDVFADGAFVGNSPRKLTITRPDGASLAVESTVFRMGDGDSRITTVMLRDVTHRDEQERLERERQQIESSARDRSLMLAYLAHEIGNPINGILGFAQLMLLDSLHPLPPAQAERLGFLMASSQQLQMLIRDVTDMSRLETSNFLIQLEPILLGAALEAACRVVQAQADAARVQISRAYIHPTQRVMADEGRLQQCLINLLSNAIKYGMVPGIVELSVCSQGGRVLIQVKDHGIGLSPAQLGHLFEPFNRLGREQSTRQGAGLGLVVTRLLITAMGGRLDVQSTPGQGSSFVIELNDANADGQEGERCEGCEAPPGEEHLD